MIHLKQYATHTSVEQLNYSIQLYTAKLRGNDRKVLRCLASHALKYPGACQLKAITIAKEVGISRATVTRIIKRLREQHIITSHNTTKKNGIMGANIYSIVRAHSFGSEHRAASSMDIDASLNEPASEPTTMSQREQAAKRCDTTAQPQYEKAESVSFNQAFNNTLTKQHVVYVSNEPSVKDMLQSIYDPYAQKSRASFNELCKIAFGRLKQGMREYGVPYTQMCEIVIRCMQQLVQKWDVHNEFALYSAMILRQVKQLFEQPITRQCASNGRTEMLPDWFASRHEKAAAPTLSQKEQADLEAARERVRQKLGIA